MSACVCVLHRWKKECMVMCVGKCLERRKGGDENHFSFYSKFNFSSPRAVHVCMYMCT